MRRNLISWRAFAVTAALATTTPARAGDEPQLVNGQLVFAEGAEIPRNLTATESEYIETRPITPPIEVTPPPEGPIRAVAEYEPMDGILVAWEGNAGWKAILAQMGASITTLGNANLYVAVDSTSEGSTATSDLTAAGANMSRVQTMVTATDSIWMRDYGPRYVYQGAVRTMIDHTYNRPRPQDNRFPSFFSTFKGHAYHEIPLVHGGGNYQLDAVTRSYATRLINNENLGLSETEIHDLWLDYQGVSTTMLDPFPTFIDSTQHLDMWMQVVADDVVIISDWPFDSGSTQDLICDQTADFMLNRGYTVHRIPARSVSGVHYTYTNVVMVNDIVLVPSYSNGTVQGHNAEALAVWQAATTRTIVPIPSQDIVTASGVLHCITMHVPAHLGGLNPTAYLQSPRGCVSLTPNDLVELRWVTDDDVGVFNVDILLSTDGGATFPDIIAAGIPDSGSYMWTVPSLATAAARLRIVARDDDGNIGYDESPTSFAISAGSGGVAPPGVLYAVRTGTDVTFTVGASPDASSYNLYQGVIGAWDSPSASICHRDGADPDFVDNLDGTVSYLHVADPDSRWYLTSGSSCLGESTLSQLPIASCGATP